MDLKDLKLGMLCVVDSGSAGVIIDNSALPDSPAMVVLIGPRASIVRFPCGREEVPWNSALTPITDSTELALANLIFS